MITMDDDDDNDYYYVVDNNWLLISSDNDNNGRWWWQRLLLLPRGCPRLEGISIEGHKGWEYGTQLEQTGWLKTDRRLWTKWWSTCFPSERIIVEASVLSLHQEWKTQTKALSRWDQSNDWSSRGYLPAIPFCFFPTLPPSETSCWDLFVLKRALA